MKRVLTILITAAFAFFQFGCAGASDAANQNSNSTPAANAETNQANTKTESTPLPVFTDADTALTEGNKLFDANEIDLAIEAYEQAVKLNPDLAEAYFKLGVSYAIREKEAELNALEVTAKEEEEPTPTPKMKRTGKKDKPERTKKSEKAFEKAVKAYEKIVAKNPKDDVAYYNLGRSLNKLNEDAESLKALRQAVKLQPENSEYQTELGEILNKLAQYDEAVRALKKALELDPTNLLAEELLEKAEAGKKRIDFAKKNNQQKEENLSKSAELPKQRTTPKPKESPSPGKEKESNVGQ